MPTLMESPCPREPVTASIPGVIMSGWPCSLPARVFTFPNLFPRDDAQLHQGRVLDENGMSLAEKKTVPGGILHRFGIEVHLGEVQSRHDLGQRTRTAQVSRLADADHLHDVGPEVPCDFFDSLNFFGPCHPSSSGEEVPPPPSLRFSFYCRIRCSRYRYGLTLRDGQV